MQKGLYLNEISCPILITETNPVFRESADTMACWLPSVELAGIVSWSKIHLHQPCQPISYFFLNLSKPLKINTSRTRFFNAHEIGCPSSKRSWSRSTAIKINGIITTASSTRNPEFNMFFFKVNGYELKFKVIPEYSASTTWNPGFHLLTVRIQAQICYPKLPINYFAIDS